MAFNREAEKYHLKYSKGVNVSNINEETERSSVMEYIKTRESGHGGGISINVFRTRPFIIHEITFQNVTVVENAAIVGGDFVWECIFGIFIAQVEYLFRQRRFTRMSPATFPAPVLRLVSIRVRGLCSTTLPSHGTRQSMQVDCLYLLWTT